MSKENQTTDQQNPNLPTTTTDQENLPQAVTGKAVEVATMEDLTFAVEKSKELGDLGKLDVGTINLKTEYLSFEDKAPGDTVRRSFLGFTMRMSVDPATGEEKGLVPAALLYDPEKETVNVCMQKVLVGVLYELGYPKGAALQITYKGKKKGKTGLRFDDFDIRALIPGKK